MSEQKKKKKEKDRDDGFKKIGGVKYDTLMDRQVGDKRFERERAYQLSIQAKGVGVLNEQQPAVSSTFDAFQRMAAGLESRTIADKLADPNRPTWEQYKKENEDKLDLVGVEVRNMVEYRAQLDKEREKRLKNGPKDSTISESDASNNSDSDSDEKSSGKRRKQNKKEKKAKKKHKKHKKSKDKAKDSVRSDSEDSESAARDSKRRRKRSDDEQDN